MPAIRNSSVMMKIRLSMNGESPTIEPVTGCGAARLEQRQAARRPQRRARTGRRASGLSLPPPGRCRPWGAPARRGGICHGTQTLTALRRPQDVPRTSQGVGDRVQPGDYGQLTSREAGNMVKYAIMAAQQALGRPDSGSFTQHMKEGGRQSPFLSLVNASAGPAPVRPRRRCSPAAERTAVGARTR